MVVIKNDALKNRPITNDRPYYFGVVAYAYLEDNAGAPFKSLGVIAAGNNNYSKEAKSRNSLRG